MAMAGEFSGEGLQALGDGEDILTAMARELVTEGGIGESAVTAWRQIQADQSRSLAAEDLSPAAIERPPSEPSDAWAADPCASCAIGMPPTASKPARPKRGVNLMSRQEQLVLF
jgi:hypothetical protein